MTTATIGRHWAYWELSKLKNATQAVRQIMHMAAERRRERRSVERLRTLDDRTLKDIGLHRTEILSVVYGPVHERSIRRHGHD